MVEKIAKCPCQCHNGERNCSAFLDGRIFCCENYGIISYDSPTNREEKTRKVRIPPLSLSPENYKK